ncbi:MAG: hypothetical protein NVSMB47_08030 [Polyangiales bacterium]
MMYFGFLMVGIAVILAIAGVLQMNKGKKILAAPFKKTGEVASNPSVADAKGNISTEGAIVTRDVLTSPQTNTPCVYFEFKVEREVEEVKYTDKGRQVNKHWQTIEERKQGTVFGLNDGSGPVGVDPTQGGLDVELKQTFSGAPGGGSGLANLLTGGTRYRATEKILPVQGNLFAMGKLANGTITKADGMLGKLMLSTKGRDGLVGHTKKMSTIFYAIGGVLLVAGIPVSIFGGAPKDTSCKTTIENEMKEACNASLKTEKPDTYTWKVTKAGIYEVSVKQPSDATVNMMANIVVRNGDIPLAIDFNPMAFVNGDAKTKVAVDKGTYSIDVSNYRWNGGMEGGFRYSLGITYVKGLDKDGTTKAAKDGEDEADDKADEDKTADDKAAADGTAAATATAKPAATGATAKPGVAPHPATTTTAKPAATGATTAKPAATAATTAKPATKPTQ